MGIYHKSVGDYIEGLQIEISYIIKFVEIIEQLSVIFDWPS